MDAGRHCCLAPLEGRSGQVELEPTVRLGPALPHLAPLHVNSLYPRPGPYLSIALRKRHKMDALCAAGLDVLPAWIERTSKFLDSISTGLFSNLVASSQARMLVDELVCADLSDFAGNTQYKQITEAAKRVVDTCERARPGRGAAGSAGLVGPQNAPPRGGAEKMDGGGRVIYRPAPPISQVRPFLLKRGSKKAVLASRSELCAGRPIIAQVEQRDLGAFIGGRNLHFPLELRVRCGPSAVQLVITGDGPVKSGGAEESRKPATQRAGRNIPTEDATPASANSVSKDLLVPGAKLLIRRYKIHTLSQQQEQRHIFFKRKEEAPISCWLSCDTSDCLFLGGHTPETFAFGPEEKTAVLLLYIHSLNEKIASLLKKNASLQNVYESLTKSLYRAVPEYVPRKPPSVEVIRLFLRGK